jgi:hypothetical protein
MPIEKPTIEELIAAKSTFEKLAFTFGNYNTVAAALNLLDTQLLNRIDPASDRFLPARRDAEISLRFRKRTDPGLR